MSAQWKTIKSLLFFSINSIALLGIYIFCQFEIYCVSRTFYMYLSTLKVSLRSSRFLLNKISPQTQRPCSARSALQVAFVIKSKIFLACLDGQFVSALAIYVRRVVPGRGGGDALEEGISQFAVVISLFLSLSHSFSLYIYFDIQNKFIFPLQSPFSSDIISLYNAILVIFVFILYFLLHLPIYSFLKH